MRKRILVVEDDAVQRSILAQFLNEQKFYVETAIDGLDAVQRARLGWFDIVLMDYRLPEVDGLAASRLIIDLTRDHGSPKIIALTSCPDAARQYGMHMEDIFFAVAAKPWSARAILDHIGEASDGADGGDRAGTYCVEALWPVARNDPGAEPDLSCRARRILLVEDDDLPRAAVTAALVARGYRVDQAKDGLEALLMIGNMSYDAAILDYALPKMNGAAAARLVHDLVARRDRPRLIALTANLGLVQDKVGGVPGAFDEIVAKSAGLDAVIDAVDRCLGRIPVQPGRSGS